MDNDAIIPALQLLIGDLNNEQRCAVINRAFPGDHVWHVVDRTVARNLTDIMLSNLRVIADINNGEPPLGRLAQERIMREVRGCEQRLIALIRNLNL